jgi:hypothetical protein
MTTVVVDDVIRHAGENLLNLAPDGSVESISDGVGTLAAYEALAVDQGFDRPTGVVVS